ncbi:glycerol 3-phosphate dehydrogenase (NAD(P)+) [Balnearium lithotrophicum]|uniref:Glycerol-3-phosphate dehydrogenase [NAD(P)+] n=1 Tax=Balnearium lithotrophicum TaxID=223788 RepID=A0A521BGX5_9BACT|nr:NAD(P)H-dependent glycerol-3-phosphate dehydrogenase [Balnearium lithotrophicum]SMO46346.1 glycerol 3-phosphate dehydrogenase (NAD(P)+) [Balnearium lithotrophicum]
MKIAVLGSGSWGSALSIHFGRNEFDVVQWCREREVSEEINSFRENRTYLPGFKYPERVRATSSVERALEGVEIVFSVIPTQFTASFWRDNKELLHGKSLVCASKGIEIESLKTLSELYGEIFGSLENYYVLSGPTFAREIASGLPAAAVVSNENLERALNIVKLLNTPSFRLYASSDVKGVELGGALKNVIAIATGISDGMGFGNNARAALITRGLHEIKRLGRKLGAREETFYGLSGVGDLVLTCTGDLSRNRQFGISIAKGDRREGNFVVEGVYTVKAVHELSKRLNIEMPISEAVYRIIYDGVEPKEVIRELLSRPVKEESS